MLSMRFHDPEGFDGEVNCIDPTYDPSTVRAEDEVIDPDWFARVAAALRAGPEVVVRRPERSPTPGRDTP